MTVHEVSRLTGVSIRTLQYYDTIGLLTPSARTGAGYRIYGQADLERLQQILLLRELEFPLKEIKAILESPDFDRDTALRQQIELLTLKRDRLDNLILFARGIQRNGEKNMNFDAFDAAKQQDYARRAREQWGKNAAWTEYEEKSRGRSQDARSALGQGMMLIFEDFGRLRGQEPGSDAVQAQVRRLQSYITEHFYTCTKDILSSLGMMYTTEEFRQNIDAAGGEGTAEFAAEAIGIYCT